SGVSESGSGRSTPSSAMTSLSCATARARSTGGAGRPVRTPKPMRARSSRNCSGRAGERIGEAAKQANARRRDGYGGSLETSVKIVRIEVDVDAAHAVNPLRPHREHAVLMLQDAVDHEKRLLDDDEAILREEIGTHDDVRDAGLV